jgi:23S rRNA (guanosine2251-2'-O)-methyltransferase
VSRAAGGSERVLAGFHAVAARLRAGPATVQAIYHDAMRRDARMRELLERAKESGVRCIASDGKRLDGFATQVPHQGVVAIVHEEEREPVSLDSILEGVGADTLLLVLDGVTDPRNLGACLRTAAAAGAQAVIAPRERSASLTPVVAKSAAGAAEIIPLVVVTNLARSMRDMRDAGVFISGADAKAGVGLYEADLAGPRAWALGAEGTGLRRLTRENCDQLVRIPMHGPMESLNVSVAAGVCLFETRRRWASGEAAAARKAG